MADKNDSELNKLRLYEKQIFSKAQEQLQSEISGLGKAALMINDLHEIYEEVSEAVAHKDREIERLAAECRQLQTQLAGKEAEAQRYRERDAYYSKLELNAAELVSLIVTYKGELQKLAEGQQKLKYKKELFEKEKASVIREKDEAVKRAEKEREEKEAANHARDQAVAENRQLEADKKKLNQLISDKAAEIRRVTAEKDQAVSKAAEEKEQIKTQALDEYQRLKKASDAKTKEISDLLEELKWMRGYAYALDEKIRRYFGGGGKRDLESHYYDYLNNPAKWEEYKVHFPQFTRNSANRQVYDGAAEKNRGTGQPAGPEGGSQEAEERLKEAEAGSEKAKEEPEEGRKKAEKRSKDSEEAGEKEIEKIQQTQLSKEGPQEEGEITPNSKVSKDI